MSMGCATPPRWIRYFSRYNASARHSVAARAKNLDVGLAGLFVCATGGRRKEAYMANPCRAMLDREQSMASFLNALHVVYSKWMCSQMLYTAAGSVSAVSVCVCVCVFLHTWMHSDVKEEIRTRSSMLSSEISFTTPRA